MQAAAGTSEDKNSLTSFEGDVEGDNGRRSLRDFSLQPLTAGYVIYAVV